jgi:hypothetical protein
MPVKGVQCLVVGQFEMSAETEEVLLRYIQQRIRVVHRNFVA